MGLWDQLTGKSASDAANAAAQDTFAKQNRALEGLVQYGDQYAGAFDTLGRKYDPYVQGGGQAQNQLLALMGLGGDQQGALDSYRSANPGLNEGLSSGSRAITGNAAAKGMLNSGATLKGLDRFGQDYSNKFFSDHLARLMGLGQQGMGAIAGQNATTGQGLQGQLGTRQSAFNGSMQAANTIGQGQIAGANAEAAGSQNLFNTGANLLGKFLGGMGGGFGGGGAATSWYGGPTSSAPAGYGDFTY